MYMLLGKRHLLRILGVLTLSAVLLVVVAKAPDSVATAADVTNWGLSFQKEGETPVGNASKGQLAQYGAYFVGDEQKPVIYLTFDAGYENGYTPQILDTLHKHGVQAAFFIVGNYLETAPDLVKRMVDEGHLVGNHTYHHPDMSAINTPESFAAELAAVETLYKEVTGKTMPKLYRPPQGKYSTENLRMAKELGYTTLFWSLAYVDWYVNDQPTPEQAYAKLLPRIHNGAVVLLHSTSATNAAILDDLLTKWKNAGYTFGSVTDFL